ncbi:CHAT domain-containing protein [Spirillospora sp. CA-253888]
MAFSSISARRTASCHHGGRDDLAGAADRLAEARSLGSPDATTRAMILYDLGLARWDVDRGTAAGPAEAVAAFREAAAIRSAPPLLRAESALEWGRVAAEGGDWTSAAEGFARVVELLPRVAPRHLDRGDQEHLLALVEGAARDSVACALRSGAADLERAVHVLERGRDVLFGALVGPAGAAGDLEAARRAAPGLVDRFEEMWARLISRRSLQFVRSGGLTVPELGERRSRETGLLVDELDEVVAEIRRLDGLSGFLRPPPVARLLERLSSRTVVMINTSRYGCDALILRKGRITAVPLPELTWPRLQELVRLHRRVLAGLRRTDPSEGPPPWLDEALRQICGVLWSAAAEPALNAAGATAPREDGWPRLWWCPTGPLMLLPVHAAHPAQQWPEPQDGVLDRVIPSLTPTLRSLAESSTAAAPGPRPPGSLLIITAPAGGRPVLEHADREGSAVERLSGLPARVMRGPEANRTAVASALPAHPFMHYVGHSGQDLANPGLGGLCLHDGDLTGLELASLRLPGASLAYLSSCEGGLGGTAVPDEPLTLAVGLRSAGFRHVIGTLWAVDDRSSAEIAEGFYRELTASGRRAPDPERAAAALHAILRNLGRARPPAVWAAYTHLGA